MPRIAAMCPNHNHKQPVQKARREQARLAIIKPRVLARAEGACEYLIRIREIQPALLQNSGSLGRIEGNFHSYCCD